MATSLARTESSAPSAPSSSGVVGELVLRAARVGRSTPWTGFGERTEFPALSRRTLEQELPLSLTTPSCTKGSSALNSPRPPVCSSGLRPVAPPRSLLHLPSRRFEKGLDRGAFLLPDRVTPRIHQSGASCPTPPPSHQARRLSGWRFRQDKFGREIQAGEIRAGDVRRETSPPVPARTFSAQSCVPHPSRGDRGRAVLVGWRS